MRMGWRTIELCRALTVIVYLVLYVLVITGVALVGS